jgi:hypothetical protein
MSGDISIYLQDGIDVQNHVATHVMVVRAITLELISPYHGA